jgi:AcrR family transcriptional regulator/DNA-binding MarR family transcriptional regulator
MRIQRERIVAAVLETVAAVGYAHMTVSDVIARAGVSRRTFYEIFANREECFLVGFEQTLSRANHLAWAAYEREASWEEGVSSALAQLLILAEQESGLAKLVVVESLAGDASVLRRRAQLLGELAEILDQGRSAHSPTLEPPSLTAEGIVGAVCALLHRRLLEDRGERLLDLHAPLMSMIVLPYLGPKAAQRELDRPAPPSHICQRERRSGARADPLAHRNIRLTYRTIRVLTAIAEHPGANNREIAEASDLLDPGQASKLLNRLAGLDLIQSGGPGTQRRPSKAWRLTELGEQLVRAIGRATHTLAA